MLRHRVRCFAFPYHRIFLFLIGLLAASISLEYTVTGYWELFPHQGLLHAAASGVLCEASKLCFGPVAIRGLLRGSYRSRLAHVPLLVIVFSLMACSMAAALGVTAEATRAAHADVLTHSEKYNGLKEDQRTTRKAMESLVELHSKQIRGSYLTESKATKLDIKDKEKRLDILSNEIAGMEAASQRVRTTLASDTAQSRNAAKFGLGVAQLITLGHFFRAALVELIALAAFLLVHANEPAQETVQRAEASSNNDGGLIAIPGGKSEASFHGCNSWRGAEGKRGAHMDVMDIATDQEDFEIGPRYAERYEKARRLITDGAMRPSVIGLMRHLNLSQRPAQRFLRALCLEGLIERHGRRYQRRVTAAA